MRSAFNIRTGEIRDVGNLFLHNFLQGFGLALIYVIANSIFLAEYSVKQLPWVFVAAGALTLIAGRIYAWFEHHTSTRRLLQGTVVVMIIILLLMRVFSSTLSLSVFAFLLLTSYHLVYLLSNLEFWGLSSLVFDVRQSKRLFGLISAGDIPAKMLGYLSVSALVPFIGLNNLLLVAAIFVALSLWVLAGHLGKVGGDAAHEKVSHAPHTTHADTGLVAYLRRFFQTRFIFTISILSFLAVITLSLVNFTFLAEVKYTYKTDEELAKFFGTFFAVGEMLTILTKGFLSGRIMTRLGARKILLALPGTILIVMGAIWVSRFLPSGTVPFLYLFGFLMLSSEILKYALHQPLSLALFQPLNRHLRLHGHTVMKGFVDAWGQLLAGAGLLIILHFAGKGWLLITISAITLMAIAWFLWVYKVDRAYLRMLGKAIRVRRFEGSEFAADSPQIIDQLKEKALQGRNHESLYALDLLKRHHPGEFEKMHLDLVRHRSPSVRTWVFAHLPEKVALAQTEDFKALLAEDGLSLEERASLLKKLCTLDHDAVNWAAPYLEDAEPALVIAAIEGLIRGRSIEGMVEAGSRLLRLKESGKPRDTLILIHLIGSLELKNFHHFLFEHLRGDGDERLYHASLDAAARIRHPALLPPLVDRLRRTGRNPALIRTIAAFGEDGLKYIHELIRGGMTQDQTLLEGAVEVCRVSEAPYRAQVLREEALHTDCLLRADCMRLLARAQVNDDAVRELGVYWLDKEIAFHEMLVSLLSESDSPQIRKAFDEEIRQLRERVLSTLMLAHRPSQAHRVREALMSGDKEKIANALDMLQGIITERGVRPLVRIFEHDSDQYGSSSTYESQLEACRSVLRTGKLHFTDWSIALALRSVGAELSEQELRPFVEDPSPIIRQEARQALLQHPQGSEFPDLMLQNITQKHETMSSNDPRENEIPEMEKVLMLKSTELFRETPEALLVELAALMRTIRLDKDETLFEEGDPGDAMYIIHSGSVAVIGGGKLLAELREPDFFGELSLLDNEPRSASVVAREDSLLLHINQEDFYELLAYRNEVGRSVLRTLSRRLRRQNKAS